jgi:hypothetical protein
MDRLKWVKSSYSTGSGGNCVEVAAAHTVSVRDSKNPSGPKLGFSRERWQAFTRSIKDSK